MQHTVAEEEVCQPDAALGAFRAAVSEAGAPGQRLEAGRKQGHGFL